MATAKVKTSFRWRDIEEHLRSLAPAMVIDMANAEGLQEMGQAQGRYQMLLKLLNLPQTLAALEQDELDRKELDNG